MQTIRTSKAFNVLFLLVGAVVVQATSACILGARTGPGVAHADTAKTVECTEPYTYTRLNMSGYSAVELVDGKAYGAIVPGSDTPGASLSPLPFVVGEGVVFVHCAAKGTITFAVP